MMATIELEKVLKKNVVNNNQKRYEDAVKKFDKLVSQGVAQKRKNQLLVDQSSVKFNF